jgi:3-hydroxyisobutyrate dehydrogenase-like beta-hydroxyacid dehydrogenase
MTRVAFLGLGAMGRPMAARLLAAGHDLRVWNRTPGRDDALVSAGITLPMTDAAAARCDEALEAGLGERDLGSVSGFLRR